ncbi:very-long-chain (3R)-3-hydroxyacyl-CoA dehydratase 4 isoform X2 [Polypterus senegalus]|uniref:very-long-chain (3R)-3-hydroxyacyl-CoA dehydratase 4 isoform X2 n=1 Tax=Polypterus senegalus TaxID=55291 RepID=UPI001966A199|nr:very-long-chain (3R)-3-hydroxyacyl-CoA dehydratase 4 isoform X2 [Polypterus senegalus]
MRKNMTVTYLFIYNLLQFCGHSWIFSNMTARLFSFGKDALADTFYSIGVVMSFFQLLSVLELFHILDGIEHDWFLPRFLQVLERNILLFVVIASQEEVQSKCIVCVLFYIWNILDIMKYTYHLMALICTPFYSLAWISSTFCIPLFPLAALAEVITIYQSLPYFEALGTFSFQVSFPVPIYVHFPYILQLYMPVLALGACVNVSYLLSGRSQCLGEYSIKNKDD